MIAALVYGVAGALNLARPRGDAARPSTRGTAPAGDAVRLKAVA